MTNVNATNPNLVKKPNDLSPEDKRALLARLLKEKAGAGGPAKPTDLSVHRLFEAQAERTPDAPAVVFDGETTSYADLNARSNRLARHLRTLGVGPDVLVGLCAERSPRMLVAILAVLKAGGAYVPLDPSYPPDRLSFMLGDAAVPVLLTESSLAGSLPAGNARVVRVEDDHSTQNPANLDGVTARDSLAYVIYTSGSTGVPKGVQVPHSALTNFLQSFRQSLGIKSTDSLLAVTTLSFDIAGLELFLPLTVGARVELASRDEAADGVRLASRIASNGVTFLQGTPATWRLLLETGWTGRDGLTMLCGGEALPRSLADRLLPKGQALWNLYGPTETTIWSTAWKVEAGDGPVLVGRPIAQTQLYVLDARLRPVPVGVAGELYIGGSGLARGYLNRPGLTADRFLPDALGPKPGARMYRTGDLARWHADGTLECLGRVDHQVKIRGFRVELGEVEAALATHPQVREVVAVAREDAAGEQALVAYLIPNAGPAPTVADLRRVIGAGLPDYMIPSAFVLLEEFPLTPNGKVDRNALPAPDAGRAAPSGVYVPPRNAIEEAVAAAFGDVLGRPRVGARDDFFDLGGHSLMAAQLLARLRDAFGVEVPLKDLFDNSNVAALSHRVEDALRSQRGEAVPPIEKADRSAPLPASFAQQRLWFLDQLEPNQATYNLPVAVRLRGELDLEALGQAFNELARRHESLRTTFAAVDGRPIQVIAPSLTIDLPIDDLTHLPEADREAEALARLKNEARRPFDLAKGPLVRVALAKLGDREHVAIVNMHHVISDGWSIGVLVRDMAALYDAFSHNEPSRLPALTIQYADFAAWQSRWLVGDALRKQIDFWTKQLAGLPNLEIPTDRPRPAIRAGRGGEAEAKLSGSLLASLKDLGRGEGATAFMALLASFQVLLARYSGQEDIAVGSPIAGRTRSEMEDLIGFFANTIVFRGDLTGDPSFREVLRRSKAAVLSAIAYQDMPFDQLVNALRPIRDTSRTPLFQVMFALQNSPMPPLESPEMKMEPIVVTSDSARADLTLFAFEAEDELLATLEYDADLFLPETIARMLRHWQTLLDAIVAEPDQPISTLPMLSEEERRQMLQQWNASADTLSQGTEEGGDAIPPDLDNLSEAELDAMLQQLESQTDAHD